jgi:TetR/AcrR family transcriptional regulator, transcriptional repressor for nem operon
MARGRQFNPDELLESAMHIFWRKGYEATSIRDIVERSGVNQFGIYALYGDKHGLFLAVLDRYRDNIVAKVFGIVEQPDASLSEIRRYFETVVAYHAIIMPALGCLMANTMAESAAGDEAIRERTRRHFERQHAGFTRALTNARRTGAIRADLNIAETAEYLAVSAQGLAVYSRINPDQAALTRYVETVLSILTETAAPDTRRAKAHKTFVQE